MCACARARPTKTRRKNVRHKKNAHLDDGRHYIFCLLDVNKRRLSALAKILLADRTARAWRATMSTATFALKRFGSADSAVAAAAAVAVAAAAAAATAAASATQRALIASRNDASISKKLTSKKKAC